MNNNYQNQLDSKKDELEQVYEDIGILRAYRKRTGSWKGKLGELKIAYSRLRQLNYEIELLEALTELLHADGQDFLRSLHHPPVA